LLPCNGVNYIRLAIKDTQIEFLKTVIPIDEPFTFRTLKSKGDLNIGNDVWICYKSRNYGGEKLYASDRIGARVFLQNTLNL
jgi:cytochrome c oxidase assembly protein Cox11